MLHNEVQSELEIYEQDWSLRSVLVCQFECMQQTQENASSESFLKVNAWCLIKKKKKDILCWEWVAIELKPLLPSQFADWVSYAHPASLLQWLLS